MAGAVSEVPRPHVALLVELRLAPQRPTRMPTFGRPALPVAAEVRKMSECLTASVPCSRRSRARHSEGLSTCGAILFSRQILVAPGLRVALLSAAVCNAPKRKIYEEISCCLESNSFVLAQDGAGRSPNPRVSDVVGLSCLSRMALVASTVRADVNPGATATESSVFLSLTGHTRAKSGFAGNDTQIDGPSSLSKPFQLPLISSGG